LVAYAVAAVLIAAIGLIRIYLNLHYPLDVVGGWMAGAALLSVLIAIHVLNVDERMRAAVRRRDVAEPATKPATDTGA
jgi:membrane-associated phospholipid phosphatase